MWRSSAMNQKIFLIVDNFWIKVEIDFEEQDFFNPMRTEL